MDKVPALLSTRGEGQEVASEVKKLFHCCRLKGFGISSGNLKDLPFVEEGWRVWRWQKRHRTYRLMNSNRERANHDTIVPAPNLITNWAHKQGERLFF